MNILKFFGVSTDKIKSGITLSMSLSSETYDRLNQLRELAGTKSVGDVFRQALRLYEFLLKEERNDCVFFVQKKNGSKEKIQLFSYTEPKSVIVQGNVIHIDFHK